MPPLAPCVAIALDARLGAAGRRAARSRPGRAADRRRQRRLRADPGRHLQPARSTSTTRRARRATLLRGREGRASIRVLQGGDGPPQPFLDITRHGPVLRRGGPALDRLPPRVREEPALLRLLHQHARATTWCCEFKRNEEARSSRRPRQRAGRCSYIPHPTAANHNGGQIQFGPDGLLYIAPGDGGGGATSATPRTPRACSGKLLRIDPRKSALHRASKAKPKRQEERGCAQGASAPPPTAIPKRQPVRRRARASTRSTRSGLRNPFRFSFDSATGALSIGDVGRAAARRSTTARRGRRRASTSAGRDFEGTRVRTRPVARRHDLPDPRVRQLRRRRPAARRSAASTASR